MNAAGPAQAGPLGPPASAARTTATQALGGDHVEGGAKEVPHPPAAQQPPLKRHMRTVQSVTVPAGFERRRAPIAVQALLPARYASSAAAKKACRRGEVLVGGARATTETEVEAGMLLEVGRSPYPTVPRHGCAGTCQCGHKAPATSPASRHWRTHAHTHAHTHIHILFPHCQVVQRCGTDPVAAAGRPGLEVAYEDGHMAAVVKPRGLPTQGKGEGSVQGRAK